MKALLCLLLFMTLPSWANCGKKPDPKKVMLFVDTNTGDKEIETARKSACARGETFVVVPENYKAYTQYTDAVEASTKAVLACYNTKGFSNSVCPEESAKLSEAYNKLSQFTASQKPIPEQIQNTLANIKNNKAKLKGLILSGHDGGGNFGGRKSSISRLDLEQMMSEYPEINDVSTLLLLGCYTGTQYEVKGWKKIFPQIRLIAGYDGSAPLAERPQGHQYISQILAKEKQLITQADETRLANFTKQNVSSMYGLNSAVYVRCESKEDEDKEFYYHSKDENKKFSKVDFQDCLKQLVKINAIYAEYIRYESGELEPPTDTANGPLRSMYNDARKYQHCLEELGSPLDANRVFNLLFYQGVKESFASYYQNDLKKAEEIIASIDVESTKKQFVKNLSELEEMIRFAEEDLEKLKADPQKYFAEKLAEIEKAKIEREQLLKDHPDLANLPRNSWGGIDLLEIKQSGLDSEVFNKFIQAEHRVYSASYLIQASSDTNTAISSKQSILEYTKSHLTQQQSVFADLDKHDFKKIWLPTAENLKTKSRKELLANQHLIHGVLSSQAVTPVQRGALTWVNEATAHHFERFQNPFSWHEATPAGVEAPSYPVPLSRYVFDNPQGYGGGGYYGGGMVGGSYGGAGFSQ